MKGVFRTSIVISALALLICGLMVTITYAAFTTHDKGVANITIVGLGEINFTTTSSGKYYPGCQDVTLDIRLQYQGDQDIPVTLTNFIVDSVDVKYSWLSQYARVVSGVATLTILPKAGTWSAGAGNAGWYALDTQYAYYTDSNITNWRCVLTDNLPTFNYEGTIAGNTSLPTFQCNIIIPDSPSGEIENGAISGADHYQETSNYMLDGCTNIRFNFSLLLTQE